MSNPALLTYVPMTPHFFWLAQVEAFRIGTVDILPNQVIKAYQVESMTKAISTLVLPSFMCLQTHGASSFTP
jgi:hypothetical protein